MTTIGISVPTTVATEKEADVRSVGKDVRNAVALAQEVLSTDYELAFRDNMNSPNCMQEIAREFREARVAGVLGLPTSREVKLSSDSLGSVPAITSMATSPQLSSLSNVFRTRVNDGTACKVLIPFLLEKGYQRIGTVSEDNDYPKDCTSALVKMGEAAGIEFKGFTFPTDNFAIEDSLRQLALQNPDAVFINSQSEYGFYKVLRQVRQVFGDIQVLGSAMPGSRKFLELAEQLADGIVYVSEPLLLEELTPFGKKQIELFRDTYGEPETGDYTVAATYASFFALHRAIQNEGEIVENLAQLTFDDPVNGAFRFKEREILALSREQRNGSLHSLKQIKDGVGVPVKP